MRRFGSILVVPFLLGAVQNPPLPVFIDGQAADPMAAAISHLGMTDKAFKQAYPTKKGIAFASTCRAMVRPHGKAGRVNRIEIWNYPLAEGCGKLAIDTLTDRYGEPERDGYGYSSAVGNAARGTSIEFMTWRRGDIDVLLMRHRGLDSSFIVHVMKAGTWNPKTG